MYYNKSIQRKQKGCINFLTAPSIIIKVHLKREKDFLRDKLNRKNIDKTYTNQDNQ